MQMTEIIADGDIGLYTDFDNRFLSYDNRFGIERKAIKTLPVIDISALFDQQNPANHASSGDMGSLTTACSSVWPKCGMMDCSDLNARRAGGGGSGSATSSTGWFVVSLPNE